MDIFIEQMVRRKKQPMDFVKVLLCLIAATLIIMMMFIFNQVPLIGTIIFFVGALLVYLIYNVGTSINLEYEYCFTNGALDIDKIIAARRRKKLTELNARDIEMMGTTRNHAFRGYMNNREIKKIYACSSVNDEDVCFVVYSVGGKRQMLLFNPNDTIKDGFRRLNPQKVFLED